MEPEGSLPLLQVPANCPYPEPDQSSPCLQTHFLKVLLNIIIPSTPGSSKWSIYLRIPHQTLVHTVGTVTTDLQVITKQKIKFEQIVFS